LISDGPSELISEFLIDSQVPEL
jgi:hypothetical protein